MDVSFEMCDGSNKQFFLLFLPPFMAYDTWLFITTFVRSEITCRSACEVVSRNDDLRSIQCCKGGMLYWVVRDWFPIWHRPLIPQRLALIFQFRMPGECHCRLLVATRGLQGCLWFMEHPTICLSIANLPFWGTYRHKHVISCWNLNRRDWFLLFKSKHEMT